MDISVERIPYILSVVVAFAVGAGLYSKLVFESAWKKAGNLSDSAMQKGMGLKLGVSLLLRVVQMYIFIHMIRYMTKIEGIDTLTIGMAIKTAFWLRLGFSAIAHLQENLWKEDINWTLFGINSISTLVMLIAGGIAYVLLAGIM